MARFSPHTRWLIGNILVTACCTKIMFVMAALISFLLISMVAGSGPSALGGVLAGLVAAAYTAVTTWREDPSPSGHAAFTVDDLALLND
jgi:hypothetical protein